MTQLNLEVLFVYDYTGRLDEVTNLTITYIRESNSYKFNWTSPATLNIPYIKTNTSYCIDINTPSSFAQLCDKKEAGFILSHVNMATEYSVNITAVNAAGMGKTTAIKLPGKLDVVHTSLHYV